MKEFYADCVDKLYSLTSINQVHWIISRADGKKVINDMIDAMVTVSKQYTYIPEEDQKRIILDRMVKEDSKYYRENGLSAWQVDKWLGMYSGHFKSIEEAEKPFVRIEHSPEQEARIDGYIEEWKKQLASISNVPNYTKVKEEIKKIQKEDKLRIEGNETVKDKVDTRKEYASIVQKKNEAIRSRGLDKVDIKDLTVYKIEGETILARNESEAQELYLEIYA